MELRKLVGLNVRKLRVKLGLPQDDFAVDARIDRAHVSRIERGVENPTLDVLGRVASALGVDITELFTPSQPGAAAPKTLKRGPKPKVQRRRKKAERS